MAIKTSEKWELGAFDPGHPSSFSAKPLVVDDYQWEFQDPKMEVPTIYMAYIRPM